MAAHVLYASLAFKVDLLDNRRQKLEFEGVNSGART
jgi:hypothetical protein